VEPAERHKLEAVRTETMERQAVTLQLLAPPQFCGQKAAVVDLVD
jgi:hypothetical protein